MCNRIVCAYCEQGEFVAIDTRHHMSKDPKHRVSRFLRTCRWSISQSFHAAPALASVSVILVILQSIVPALQAIFISQATDALITNATGPALFWALASGLSIAGYLAVQSVSAAAERSLQFRLQARCFTELNATVAALPPTELSDSKVAASMREARQSIVEMRVAQQLVALLSLLQAIVVCVSLLATIGRINALAGILVVLSMFPQIIALILYSRADKKGWPEGSRQSRLAAYREEQVLYQATAMELAGYDARQHIASWGSHHRNRCADITNRLNLLDACLSAAAGVLASALLIGALAALITSGASSASIAGGLTAVLSGAFSVYNAGYMIGTLFSSAVSVDSYVSFVHEYGDISRGDVSHGNRKTHANELDVRSLSVVYPGSKNPTVHDISLHAAHGEIIALVGANGAGKTTTVQGIIGMLQSTGGHVAINGIDVTDQDFVARHQWFGLMTQEFGRYEFTVREDLLIGARDRNTPDDALWSALEQAHAADFVRALPDGLDTQLGNQWDGVGLSGGQWQRLALARLILRDAPIWILDEPTSSVDAQTEAELFSKLRAHAAQHIIIVVSHRAWTLRDTDRIYVLDDGRIVESGTYNELRHSNTKFAKLFAFQNEESSETGRAE